jgi:RNA polymerase sigma factor (TIGR02999 family)
MNQQGAGHTLQPTALVHEAYLKLAANSQLTFPNRASFLALMARAMRQILVDHARARQSGKRGGGMPKVSLEEGHDAPAQRPRDVVALDDAMTALARLDPRKAQVVELRYFGGLTGDEIASALGIGTATVTREAALAEAWLRRELTRMPEARG